MNFNLQSLGNFLNIGDGNIFLTPFDAANVCSVQIALKSKALLRVAEFGSQLADFFAELFLYGFMSARHEKHINFSHSMTLHSINSIFIDKDCLNAKLPSTKNPRMPINQIKLL
jgi:hypothetical protein